MQMEDMDHRIREAAENHHPAYTEKAWPEMEKLLDKHLPVEKKRRRRILFWWLLPLLAGGSFLLYMQLQKQKKDNSTITNMEKAGVSVNDQTLKTNTNNTLPSTGREDNPVPTTGSNAANPDAGRTTATTTSGNLTTTPVPSRAPQPTTAPTTAAGSLKNDNQDLAFSVQNGTIGRKKRNVTPAATNNKPVTTNDPHRKKEVSEIIDPATAILPPAMEKQQLQTPPANQPVINNSAVKDAAPATLANTDAAEKRKTASADDSVKAVQKNTVAIKVPRKKSKSSFFLSFSAGPDLSFVSSERPGTVKLVAGMGLGYNYKDRLTLRTGFYTARKIYTADAASYHTPPGFTQYYPYLEKVDANCKVYEIPVLLSYNFGRKNSRHFFVSGGLSTLLMNEETYNYYYKYTPQGRTYTNKWTIRNENKHFFSVLTLSGGYQRNFGKRLSLAAEPYLKLPLGGVGYGRVKLNSGGVLFSAGLKLF